MKFIWLSMPLFMMVGYFYFFRNTNTKNCVAYIMATVLYLMVQIFYLSSYFDFLMVNKKLIVDSLLYFVILPLIIYSIPQEKMRVIFWNYRMKRILIFMKQPILSISIFYTLFFVFHIPALYSKVMSFVIIELLLQLTMIITAFFLWYPILNRLPEIPTLEPLKKLLLLFANSVLIVVSYLPIFSINGKEVYSTSLVNEFIQGATVALAIQEFMIVILLGYVIKSGSKSAKEIDKPNFAYLSRT